MGLSCPELEIRPQYVASESRIWSAKYPHEGAASRSGGDPGADVTLAHGDSGANSAATETNEFGPHRSSRCFMAREVARSRRPTPCSFRPFKRISVRLAHQVALKKGTGKIQLATEHGHVIRRQLGPQVLESTAKPIRINRKRPMQTGTGSV